MTTATTLAKALQISSGRTTAPKGNEPAILTKKNKTIVKLTFLCVFKFTRNIVSTFRKHMQINNKAFFLDV